MSPFSRMPHSHFEVIAPGGEIRCTGEAVFTDEVIAIFDEQARVVVGDEIRRRLPNGMDDTYQIAKVVFYEKTHGIPGHFQVFGHPKGHMPHREGGNFNITINGHNGRVNIDTTDNSTNSVGDNPVFGQLMGAIDASISGTDRDQLISVVQEMQSASGASGFKQAYQKFMTCAANHMTVVGPFLPALAALL